MIYYADKMSQVSIIDVIYLTDNVKIPVASIYGVYDIGLDKLMTFSVACAFVSDEKEGTFECFLQQLKNLLIQSNVKAPNAKL